MDDENLQVIDYTCPKIILGKDFLSPEQIAAETRKITYSPSQLKYFSETLPSQDILKWCRTNGFMLIAGPPEPLSLLQIRDIAPWMFYLNNDGWYSGEKQNFSRKDIVASIWLILRKGILPNSTNKTWHEQQKLLPMEEYIPNVAELAWSLTTYKKVNNIDLLNKLFVRSKSCDSEGVPVDIGYSRSLGLRIGFFCDENNFKYLGLTTARESLD